MGERSASPGLKVGHRQFLQLLLLRGGQTTIRDRHLLRRRLETDQAAEDEWQLRVIEKWLRADRARPAQVDIAGQIEDVEWPYNTTLSNKVILSIRVNKFKETICGMELPTERRDAESVRQRGQEQEARALTEGIRRTEGVRARSRQMVRRDQDSEDQRTSETKQQSLCCHCTSSALPG